MGLVAEGQVPRVTGHGAERSGGCRNGAEAVSGLGDGGSGIRHGTALKRSVEVAQEGIQSTLVQCGAWQFQSAVRASIGAARVTGFCRTRERSFQA